MVCISDAKKLLEQLEKFKEMSCRLWRYSQEIGFPEDSGGGDESFYNVTVNVGNVMCDIDEAIGSLNDWIDNFS